MLRWPPSIQTLVKMKTKIYACVCGFLLGTVACYASALDAANERFKSGDFAGAAAAYEEILSTEGPRASVYYNLGNSHQQLKQYGPAILAYERARLLSPRDADLLANLTQARKAVEKHGRDTRATSLHPWLEAALNCLSRSEWSWLLAGSSMFLGVLAVVAGVVKLPRRSLVISTSAMGLIIAISGTALYLRRGEAVRGIVLSETAAVRLSPFEKAESLGAPGAGSVVELGAQSGKFRYVEIPDSGLSGWLADGDVAAISP